MRMLNPPHPGDFIRTEVIEPPGLTVTAAAVPGPGAFARTRGSQSNVVEYPGPAKNPPAAEKPPASDAARRPSSAPLGHVPLACRSGPTAFQPNLAFTEVGRLCASPISVHRLGASGRRVDCTV